MECIEARSKSASSSVELSNAAKCQTECIGRWYADDQDLEFEKIKDMDSGLVGTTFGVNCVRIRRSRHLRELKASV